MQYPNTYPHNGHQTQQPHSSSHHSQQSTSRSNSHNSGYVAQQQQGLSGYPLNSPLPNGMIGNHSSSILHPAPFSNHPQHGSSPTADTRRSYYPPPANQPNTYFSSHPHSPAPGPQYTISHAQLDAQTVRTHAHTQQFIPTPTQTYQVYSNTTTSNQRVRPTLEPYYHMSPNPQHSTQRSSPPPPPHSAHTSTSPSSNPPLVVDRYPCDLCDRSFTRSHDRRRHYETVHAPTPVLHRCRYCGKDFSRADSLKRHVDNGCDEMR